MVIFHMVSAPFPAAAGCSLWLVLANPLPKRSRPAGRPLWFRLQYSKVFSPRQARKGGTFPLFGEAALSPALRARQLPAARRTRRSARRPPFALYRPVESIGRRRCPQIVPRPPERRRCGKHRAAYRKSAAKARRPLRRPIVDWTLTPCAGQPTDTPCPGIPARPGSPAPFRQEPLHS